MKRKFKKKENKKKAYLKRLTDRNYFSGEK